MNIKVFWINLDMTWVVLVYIDSSAHYRDDTEASRGPGGLGAWIRLTRKANWRVACVDLGSIRDMERIALLTRGGWMAEWVAYHLLDL